MAGQERPVRRTEVFACTVLLVVACGAVAGFFGFLGFAVHPAFLAFAALVAGGGAGIGWWMWRDLRRTDRAMERIEETVLIDYEAIARYRPAAAARHPFTAGLWRQIRRGRRAAKRSQEVAR